MSFVKGIQVVKAFRSVASRRVAPVLEAAKREYELLREEVNKELQRMEEEQRLRVRKEQLWSAMAEALQAKMEAATTEEFLAAQKRIEEIRRAAEEEGIEF